jgi:hypothetical protein
MSAACRLPPPKAMASPGRSKEAAMTTQQDRDNHANQLNPNNDAYWQSRGEDERPSDWEEGAEVNASKLAR